MANFTDGIAAVLAGETFRQAEEILSDDINALNTAPGNSDTPFIDPRTEEERNDGRSIPGKPDDQGLPVPAEPRISGTAFHRGPEERYYVTVEPSSNDINPNQGSSTLYMYERTWNKMTGNKGRNVYRMGDRQIGTSEGKVQDDKTIAQGQEGPFLATPALSSNEFGQLQRRFQFKPNADTV